MWRARGSIGKFFIGRRKTLLFRPVFQNGYVLILFINVYYACWQGKHKRHSVIKIYLCCINGVVNVYATNI
jgi:hypothetical protein